MQALIADATFSRAGGKSRGITHSRTLSRATVPPGATASDEALVEAVAGGDSAAMKMLYKRYAMRVYRFVRGLTGNPTLAEDIASDVFLDVWRHADGFRGRSQVSTWLLAIARKKALSSFRRRADEQLDDEEAAALEDTADDAEILVCNTERSAIIRKCLAHLPDAQRDVVDLIYYRDKRVGEVARIVGAPISTVKTRMFYARRRMEGLLQAAGLNSA